MPRWFPQGNVELAARALAGFDWADYPPPVTHPEKAVERYEKKARRCLSAAQVVPAEKVRELVEAVADRDEYAIGAALSALRPYLGDDEQ